MFAAQHGQSQREKEKQKIPRSICFSQKLGALFLCGDVVHVSDAFAKLLPIVCAQIDLQSLCLLGEAHPEVINYASDTKPRGSLGCCPENGLEVSLLQRDNAGRAGDSAGRVVRQWGDGAVCGRC